MTLTLLAGAQELKKRGDKDEEQSQSKAAKPAQEATPQEPPEEDESLIPKQYAFNPLEADKNFKVGSFYFKKGSYKAAALRYEEATRWNPGMAEAWLRLGESQERLKNSSAARKAYAKFLEVAPDDKDADEVRKKLNSLSTAAAARGKASDNR
jgi:tetratricopeptide (TPR) repeat protein